MGTARRRRICSRSLRSLSLRRAMRQAALLRFRGLSFFMECLFQHGEDCPVESIPPAVRVVFDTIYNPLETRLIRLAKDAGRIAIPGLEMFVQQAVAQFQIWTGRRAPLSVMRETVRERLQASR